MRHFIGLIIVLFVIGCDSDTSASLADKTIQNQANAEQGKDANAVAVSNKTEEQYVKSCRICHDSGIAGAPKIGDRIAWNARAAKGTEALLSSIKNGMGAMPPNGYCNDCSDEDFNALIDYMINPK